MTMETKRFLLRSGAGKEPGVKAIISDIHSNLEALRAVLEDIEKQSVIEIYCLGDVIGYGPNPHECIDLVMNCRVVLLGHHDQGALFDPDGFNPTAEMAIMWTRQQLERPNEARAAQAKRWEFLAERPRSPHAAACVPRSAPYGRVLRLVGQR